MITKDHLITEIGAEALKIVTELRRHGLIVEREFVGRKPGSQFKTADKLKAKVDRIAVYIKIIIKILYNLKKEVFLCAQQ